MKRLKLIYRNLLIILNMKGINYNNLRELTVFDICDNPSLLKEIAIDKTKEAHMKRCKEKPVYQAFCLLDFADRTKNKQLREVVVAEWREELKRYFNE